MDVQQLMEVKPEVLAEGLLVRWKALEEQLPNVIRNLEAEEEALAPKVKRAVEAHATANNVVATNKQKRNTAQTLAREMLVEVRESIDTLSKTGGMINLDPEWKKMKLLEELENIESTMKRVG